MPYKNPVLVANGSHIKALDFMGKGDLIDLCWSLAGAVCGESDNPEAVWATLSEHSEAVSHARGKGSPSVSKMLARIQRKQDKYRREMAMRTTVHV